MFSDPIILQSDYSSSTSNAQLARVDTDDGKASYSLNNGSGTFQRGTIAHTVSKENGPIVLTDRHQVRFDHEKVDPSTGKPIRAFAQIVIGAPRSQFTNAEITLLVYRLVNFMSGRQTSWLTTQVEAGFQTTTLRLLNGEV